MSDDTPDYTFTIQINKETGATIYRINDEEVPEDEFFARAKAAGLEWRE